MNDKINVLRLDGEVWECAQGFGDEENSIKVVPIDPMSDKSYDKNALARGITHRQVQRNGYFAHELRRLS